jgi:hypothetical protein
MFINVSFLWDVSVGRVLSDLRNVKKNYTPLRKYICQADENSGLYSLLDEEGNLVAQCHFQTSSNGIAFTLFRGKEKEELFRMLNFRLVEDIGEKAHVMSRDSNFFFDLQNFFLKKKGKYYILGNDYEKLIPVKEMYRIPQEIR